MKKLLLLVLCVPLFMASCSELMEGLDPNGSDQTSTEVTFKTNINGATRVVSDLFQNGDEISVTAIEGEATYAEKVLHTYNDGIFAATLPICFGSDDQLLSFRAVYPAIENFGETFTFAAETNQAEGDNYEMSDLLVSEVTETNNRRPTLDFYHKMSCVEIEITPSDMAGGTLTLYGATQAEFNFADQSCTASGAAQAITAAPNGESGYKLIVAPQTFEQGARIATYQINGKSYDWTLPNKISYKSGCRYSYGWDIETNIVKFNSCINGWEDSTDDSDETYEHQSGEITFDQNTGFPETASAEVVASITVNGTKFNYLNCYYNSSYDNLITVSGGYIYNTTPMKDLTKIVLTDDYSFYNYSLYAGNVVNPLTTKIEYEKIGNYYIYTIPAGCQYITLANESTHNAQSVLFDFYFTPFADPILISAEELSTIEDGTRVTIEDLTIDYIWGGYNYASNDDNLSVLIYQLYLGAIVGQNISVTGTVNTYQSAKQITEATLNSAVSGGNPATPIELTIDEYIASYNKYLNQYICIKGVSISGSTLIQGDSALAFYNKFGVESVPTEGVYDVYGYGNYYAPSSAVQIFPVAFK